MSKRTIILKENWTAYPNELIRNPNRIMTKNERNLMIYLWDRIFGYEIPNSELSYSVILRNCKELPKNNAKLSDAIKGLEKKGLLKVFRTNRNTNKYFIGEKQLKILQWYGKNFKGWKDGIIEPPKELLENEIEEENEPKERTAFDEVVERELEQERSHNRFLGRKGGFTDYIEQPQKEIQNEPKIYINQLTENEFKELYPDIDMAYFSICRNQTIEVFNKTTERIRKGEEEAAKNKKTKAKEEKIEEPEIDFSKMTY